MSEAITHMMVADDTLRLVADLPDLAPPFREVARSDRAFARLGGVTRHGDHHTVSLLESLRDRWPDRSPEDRLEAKLAFVLGWLSHRSADRQMKPVFRALDADGPDGGQSPKECSVYNDALIFRRRFMGSPDNPFPTIIFEGLNKHPAAEQLKPDSLQDFFKGLFYASLMELHTFSPDDRSIEPWLDHLFTLNQKFYVEIPRYTAAILDPDPDKERRFLTEPNFYDPDDPVIAAAELLHSGKSVAPQAIEDALAADNPSHYAQILVRALAYIRAASDCFQGKLDRDGLHTALDIGQPGCDGQKV
jgi:hypothetical protein